LANAHDVDNRHHETQFPNLDDPASIDIYAAINERDMGAVQRWVGQFGDLIDEDALGLDRVNLERPPQRYCRPYSTLFEAWGTGDIKVLELLLAKTPNIDRVRAELLVSGLANSTKISSDMSDVEEYLMRSIQWEKFPSHIICEIFRLKRISRNEVLSLRILQSLSAQLYNLQPHRGESVLNLVARLGFDSCVRLLVQDCEVDANFVTKNRRTALIDAAERGRTSTVRTLVDECRCNQATIYFMTKDGATAADIAARNGHESIIPLLLRDETSSPSPRFKQLIAIYRFRKAAIDGDLDVLAQYLHLDGFPIDLPDRDFYTPFLYAVENGHTEAVDVLISRGGDRIDINRRCLCHHHLIDAKRSRLKRCGATALVIACVNGYEDIAGRLLRCNGLDDDLRITVHYF